MQSPISSQSRTRRRRSRIGGVSARVLPAGLLLASAVSAAAQPAPARLPAVAVEATPLELHVAADFTGNGMVDTVVIDRASGAYRLGSQDSGGEFTWGEPQASGVGGVTGAAAGLFFDSSRYALAVTAPEANRVSFAAPSEPYAGPVAGDVPNAIGPLALVSGQVAGTTAPEDLVIASVLNSGPNVSHIGRYENDPAGTLGFLPSAFESTGTLDRTRRVILKNTLSSTVAFMEETGGGATLRVASLNEGGSPVRLTVTGLPGEARYVLVPFAGATYGTLLTYVPGEALMTRRAITEDPADTYTAGDPEEIPLPFPVTSLAAVEGGGEVRLAFLREDRSELAIHEFDGTALGPRVQSIAAPSPFTTLSGLVPLGDGGGFVALHSAGSDRGTAGARIHAWDGAAGEFVAGAADTFPEIAPRAGAANVTLLTGEPFVEPSARPVSLRNARDWTSGPPPPLPGSLDVTAEAFLGEADGLGDPVALDLGPSPDGASHALLNQYQPAISVFTLARAGGARTGRVEISPPPGRYSKSVELRFQSVPPGLTIFFRDAGGEWQAYVDPGPEPDESDPGYGTWFDEFAALVRFEATTIEYFGQDGSGGRTPVRRAEYRFTAPPDTLSTLEDNVPDYVKLGLGMNPFRPPEADTASGATNALQQVLDGSGVDPRWLAGSAIDLFVRPLSHDGESDAAAASRLATDPPEVLPDGTEYGGNQIFVYSLSGGLLGQGADPIPTTSTRNEGLGVYDPPFAEASAFLPDVGGAETTVFVAATRRNFALAGPEEDLPPPPQASSHGRQLIGVLPVERPHFPVYTRPYTGGAPADEADAWVAGASGFYAGEPPPVVAETVDSIDVVAALVFERWLLLRFLDRGLLPGSYAPPDADVNSPPPANPDHLTLSGFRTRETAAPMGDAPEGAVAPSQRALRAVGQWDPSHEAYRLASAAAAIRETLRSSRRAGVSALRMVALDLFRISAARGNEFPGAFAPPIDVLRAFFATGEIPEPYRADFTDLEGAPFTSLPAETYADALDGFEFLLGVPQARPTEVLEVVFREDSLDYPGCLVVNDASDPETLYSLFNPDGQAFRLPANFGVLPGTRLEVRVFTDAPFPACAGSSVEVIELGGAPLAEIALLPDASGEDSDGNLLGDDWEKAFFGHTGVDPWADTGGDGYTNLQKYLDGKDPFVASSYGSVPAEEISLPTLSIEPAGSGEARITFAFPEEYADAIDFRLFENQTLADAWTPAEYSVLNPSPGVFEVVVPSSLADRRFWRIGLSLK